MRKSLLTPVFAVGGALLLLFLALPIVAMIAKEGPATLWGALRDPEVLSSFWVSLSGAAVATAVALVCGVPLGYVLARRQFPGRAVVQGLVDMPVVVPHTVAGIALLGVVRLAAHRRSGPTGVVGDA